MCRAWLRSSACVAPSTTTSSHRRRAAAARLRRRRRREGRPGERGLTRGGASGAVVALVVPERREEPRANRARELGLVRPGVVRREGDVEGVGRGGAGDGETRRVVSRHRRIRRRRRPRHPSASGGCQGFRRRRRRRRGGRGDAVLLALAEVEARASVEDDGWVRVRAAARDAASRGRRARDVIARRGDA